MKRLRKWMFVLGILMICLLGVGILHSIVVESKEINRDMTNEHLEDVYLNSDIDELDPSSLYPLPVDTNEYKNSFSYYELVIALNETNQINYISTKNKDVQTSQGISVGDHKDKIVKQYGANYHDEINDDNHLYISYQDRQAEIRFWLDDDRVYLIELIKL
ncbi:hypothetical protein [Alkalicoccobacillus plakortidis]|uniref:DUF5590 domain-containing protein n=1 Tax=Alkalicoccobacillus plakortidis TaxID=444060 RepID=A0ABT0XF85_9BACI|nr:hypothetical protein [Alkalicoccobacillus plakortidis]MCM2674558.1 hypothetical protein [Alkalicoccobacillus plakortidis]